MADFLPVPNVDLNLDITIDKEVTENSIRNENVEKTISESAAKPETILTLDKESVNVSESKADVLFEE